jgi:hypothetical protein
MRKHLFQLKDFAKQGNAGSENVFFMSGYAADIVSEKGVLEQDLLSLAKSIAPQVLLK